MYNSSEYISQSVKSILDQTFNDFEIIIINDGSTDNSEEKILAIKDPRITYHKLAHQGLSKVLNYGISIAKYDIIARMDADDIALPDRFEKQLNVMRNNPELDIISCWYAMFTEKGIRYIVKTPEKSSRIEKDLLLYSQISHPGILAKKDLFFKHGMFTGGAFGDYELWLSFKGKVIFYNLQEVLMLQRFRTDSLSRNDICQRYKEHYEIQAPYYSDLQKSFGIIKTDEQNYYRGWREYLYGERSRARKYWNLSGLKIIYFPKVIIAYIISFLPQQLFIKVKENRIRFRLEYYLEFFKEENYACRKYFKINNAQREA